MNSFQCLEIDTLALSLLPKADWIKMVVSSRLSPMVLCRIPYLDLHELIHRKEPFKVDRARLFLGVKYSVAAGKD